MIVVAALIASTANQSLTSIPDGVKEDPKETLAAYICVNTVACMSSLMIIEYMTGDLLFGRGLKSSYLAIGVSLGISSVAQLKEPGHLTIISLIVCFLIPLLLRLIAWFKSKK